MRINRIFISIVLLFLFLIQAQSDNLPTIDHITSNNGLSHNTIRCMLQDTTGFLWFGSLNGLNRYDGIKIKTLNPDNINTNSLSSGKIKELHKDSRGYIWIRTYSDVIHCYDPYTEEFLPIISYSDNSQSKFNLFYEDNEKNIWLGSVNNGCMKISFKDQKIETHLYSTTDKLYKLSSNTVNDIFEDSHKNIWILTANGITLHTKNKVSSFDTKQTSMIGFVKAFESNGKLYFIAENGRIDIFDAMNHKYEGSVSLPVKLSVFRSAMLAQKFIIITSYSKGVYLYDLTNQKLLNGENLFGEKISGNAYLQRDQYGNIWVYNFTGNVWMLNGHSKPLKINLIPQNILTLIDEERYQFQGDRHGNIWITTYGNGLFCYHLKTGKLTHYTYNKNNNGLSSNYLLCITLDKNDNIWIGTESMGINKLSFSNRNVDLIFPDKENKYRSGNNVRSFLEDKSGNIWVATKAGNLYLYNSSFIEKKIIFENAYNVYHIMQDNAGNVWLATRGNGIIELKNGNYKKPVFYQSDKNPGSLSNNNVFSLTMDRKGRLWAATFGGGLCVKTMNNNTETFLTFFNDDEWIRFTRYVFEDNKGDIWVATTNGVIRFNPDKLLENPKDYSYYTFSNKSENSLSNPEVRYIFQDSGNNIWLATAGGGINKFIKEGPDGNGIFKVYHNQQGIAYDNIMAILEGNNGAFWVSSESGLQTFYPSSGLFQYYRFSDDFSSNLFSETTAYKCRDGRMLWGTLNGFYVFNPNQLPNSSNESNKVVLTGFFIYDQEAKIGDKNEPLKKSIAYSDKITLKASDKVFHIEFSNMNFRDPKSNQFMFILDNFEKRWNISASYNIATYRNVPPGKYTFRVKSVNSKGVWSNDETTLEIIIRPPFWQSDIAYLIYFVLIVVAAYFISRLILKFNRLSNAVKVERQLTDYKLRFFTNISHEFRTPLTLIKGSVETLSDVKDKMSDAMQHIVEDLDKNTNHLLRLIDQLLEFRKLQNNKQKLNLQRVDAIGFLKEIYTSFSNVAAKTNIDYRFNTTENTIPVYFDKNKVDKIVFNLLSNAFKFTPRGGKISLNVETDPKAEVLRISVADNGIGIPKEKQNQLFSRFMQINFSNSGTGIGLSLVNEFTTLHKGKVSYSENEGGGSVFMLEFPLNSNIYDKNDFVTEQITVNKADKKEIHNIADFIDPGLNDLSLNLLPHVPLAGKKYKILVVDDNDDIRDYLTEKLSPYYEIITATDGNTGIHKSKEDDPDLIICDVMMPGMNGFELTKSLKDDFATCHIPVILLTAYISDEHHTEGIQAGADAYISKPFSMKHLMLQINKLLEKRELLHKHYANTEIDDTEEDNEALSEQDSLPEKDLQFMKLVEEILEMHLTNADFSVDEFAALTNTGRTLFFKKIKSLTGYSPNEFIRFRRMKKAAELLKTYKYNVSEVSYMVGINDPFYFSKCFKAQYGCSPSKYLNS
ncbi:MAG: two-component regulator propeller domain-containing protein [Paludibacter sp.]|nr:two-component regulator propeller domain-containing protein [Paludibacter sp.]